MGLVVFFWGGVGFVGPGLHSPIPTDFGFEIVHPTQPTHTDAHTKRAPATRHNLLPMPPLSPKPLLCSHLSTCFPMHTAIPIPPPPHHHEVLRCRHSPPRRCPGAGTSKQSSRQGHQHGTVCVPVINLWAGRGSSQRRGMCGPPRPIGRWHHRRSTPSHPPPPSPQNHSWPRPTPAPRDSSAPAT